MAQYATIGENKQYRVPHFGAMLPILSVLGCWAALLGVLQVQVRAMHEQRFRNLQCTPHFKDSLQDICGWAVEPESSNRLYMDLLGLCSVYLVIFACLMPKRDSKLAPS